MTAMFTDFFKSNPDITVTLAGGEALCGKGPVFNSGDICVKISDEKITLSAITSEIISVSFRYPGALPRDSRFLGDRWERGYGDLEFKGFAFDRVMPWFFYAVSENVMAIYGVRVRPDALVHFNADTSGITLSADCMCGCDGVVLCGKEITLAEPVFAETEFTDVSTAMNSLASLLAKDAVFPDEPVYGFNNWYYAYGHFTSEEIREDAKYLARLTQGSKNRPFYVIDDGWQIFRTDDYNGGPWRDGNEKNPDMGALAADMKEIGVRPGLWFRPMQNIDRSIPDRLYYDPDDNILDISRPEVLEYIADDVRCFCGWGYELIKYDFSTFDIFGVWNCLDSVDLRKKYHFADRSKTNAMLAKDLYKTVFDAADGRALILGCNCIGHLGCGYMQLNRTGDDTSGRTWRPNVKNGVNALAFRMSHHGNFYLSDADCACLTKNVPWRLNKQWLELLSKSGTPLFVAVAPTTLDDTQNEFLSAALLAASRPQPAAKPLDIFNNISPCEWKFGEETKEFNWFL